MNDGENFSQLLKQIEWLDTERRNDKTVLAALQSKIEDLVIENAALKTHLNDLESEISRINTLMARVNQFEVDLNNVRSDLTKQVDEIKNIAIDKSLQTEKHSQWIEDFNMDMIEVRRKLATIDQFPEFLDERKEEDIRLARLIEVLKTQIKDISQFDEDFKRALKLNEESARQEAKRLTDLQGETAALRKRINETRDKQELSGDNVRKLDFRIKELIDAESERKEAQTAFIETINVGQVERDRTFRSWSERFEKMEVITEDLEQQIFKLEETHGVVDKSLNTLDEVTHRFDRRVNEITEVQRLNEDRFRQEWTTFKSDDQKRWSNYTLAQDEQHREMNRELESYHERIASLEDLIKRLNDTIDQTAKGDIKRMQAQLLAIRESIEIYNKIFKS